MGWGGTKYIHFQPLSHPISAKLFIAEVVRLRGLPESIVTKRDVFVLSQFWAELFKQAG